MISGMPTIWAILALITLLPVALAAADPPSPCEYSCPGKNQNEWELWNTPTALGWDSAYSIFECMYSTIENHKQNKRTCSYYKTNGKQALGYAGDACPPQAIECSTVETPLFSTQGKYETPPWVEHGRELAHLMGHPIAG
ncbi:ectomycorrhiza-regulated small secreted protein [Amanita muscaria]